MNLWNYLMRAIGLAEKEYHHIVAGFHTAINDLKALEERKSNEVFDLAAEIRSKTSAKELAASVASQAKSTAAKIEALVA